MKDPDVQLDRAIALHRVGDRDGVRALLCPLWADADPDDLTLRAQTASRAGDLPLAGALFALLLAERPHALEAWYALGQVLFSLGWHDDAAWANDRVLERHPAHARALVARGNVALARRDHEGAIRAYDAALGRYPDNAEALHNRGVARAQRGEVGLAAASFRAAVVAAPEEESFHASLRRALGDAGIDALATYEALCADLPGSAEAHFQLGVSRWLAGRREAAAEALSRATALGGERRHHARCAVALLSLGRDAEALVHAQRMVDLSPDDAEGHVIAAAALAHLSFPDAAREAAERAHALDPENIPAIAILANLRVSENDLEGARALLEQGLALAPTHEQLASTLAKTNERGRDFGEARAILERAVASPHPSPSAACAWSLLADDDASREQAIALLRRSLPQGRTDGDLRQVHFSLGRLLDRQGRFDEAFAAYAEGNALRRAVYDAIEEEHFFARIAEAFSPDAFASARRGTVDASALVFIVGMPRSGTSLVEQILDRHPAIHGCGELGDLPDLVAMLPAFAGTTIRFPEIASVLDVPQLDWLARTYLEQTKPDDTAKPYRTDKLPHNFLRVGLIALAFPGARIVHCRRDPRDNALSLFFQDFAGHHPYAYDLAHIAHYQRMYAALMAHWRTLGIDVVDVDYEALVDDQEGTSRRLLERLGLPWDPACLAFHESRRVVNTASFQQVRRPLYRGSVARWRHYEAHLGPVLAVHGSHDEPSP